MGGVPGRCRGLWSRDLQGMIGIHRVIVIHGQFMVLKGRYGRCKALEWFHVKDASRDP